VYPIPVTCALVVALEGVDLDPSAGSGSGHSVVGPFPTTKC